MHAFPLRWYTIVIFSTNELIMAFNLIDIPLSAVVVTCSLLPIPNNGRRSSSRRNYNDRVSFSCNTGYKLRGNSSRTCQSTGQWSGIQPTCDSKLLCPPRVWFQRMNAIYYSYVMLFTIPSQS